METSPYLFNKQLKFYYDEKTGFYYGGDPPEWVQNPKIPDGAKYENLMKGKIAGVRPSFINYD
jgi:hypothetical protein